MDNHRYFLQKKFRNASKSFIILLLYNSPYPSINKNFVFYLALVSRPNPFLIEFINLYYVLAA